MTTSLRSKIRKTEFVLDTISIHGNLIASEQLHKLSIAPQTFNALANYGVPTGFDVNDAINNIYYRMAHALWESFKLSWSAIDNAKDNTEAFVQKFLSEVFGFKKLLSPSPCSEECQNDCHFSNIDAPPAPTGKEDGGKGPIRVPIVIAPFAYETSQRNSSLDVNREEFGNGRRKCSAFAYTQDYLNTHDESLWGIVTNGKTLRILRNNSSLTTSAYIEINFEQIFEYNKYDEFRIAWLLLHTSMFGNEDTPVAECALENMRKAGIENGSRIADRLRIGVKQALLALGNGFLRSNPALRQQIQNRELRAQTYYNELLRIIYRLIFLITVEERGFLHPKDATKTARERYLEGYSFSRIRNRTIRRTAHDRYTDLWEAMQITFEGLANGQKELGLPALGGLFDLAQCPHIHGLKLRNDDFLEAAHNLLWLADETHLVRINWRDMGPEEFGSVYEGLLEITPSLSPAGDHFLFIEFTEQSGGKGKGSERKSTGSYYTPDSLVQVILNHTLVPLIDRTIAQNQKDPVKALLSLTIVDPACGSGHFLLSAARRLANKVAELRCPLDTPTPEDRQRAHRDVIKNCIYGVDINPMAVELCRVSLWLETIKPGEPLSFLDSHIQCGNSLLGATPELIQNGIPDDAWQPDNPNGKTPEDKENKQIASALKKRNAAERKKLEENSNYNRIIDTSGISVNEQAATETQEIESAPENTIEDIRQKKSRYQILLASEEYQRDKRIADAWCAAFLWDKSENLKEYAPTCAVFERLRNGNPPSPVLAGEIERITQQHHLFHWQLQFPQVFKNGGFDCVLGNPPWEKLKLQEEEFFATRSPDIASAQGDKRKELIKTLKSDCPKLYDEYIQTLAHRKRETNFVISSKRYPFCGKGDINLYCIFAEHNRSIMKSKGVAGFIVPSGIACDDTTADFFVDLVKTNQLSKFYSFENKEGLFPAVHRSYNFGLLMLEGEVSPCAAMASPYAATPSQPLPRPDGHPLSINGEGEFKAVRSFTATEPGQVNAWNWGKTSKVTGGVKIDNVKLELAKQYRSNPTPKEEEVWEWLRAKRLLGLKWRRQQLIDGYIADFYCSELHLALELDGSIHDSEQAKAYDEIRNQVFASKGIRTLRVSNNCTLHELISLIKSLNNSISSPSPFMERGPGGEVKTLRPDFVFYAHKKEDLDDEWRHFTMTAEDFAIFNPNSHTCMTFRSQRDKELNAKIYRRAGGILWRDEPDVQTDKPKQSPKQAVPNTQGSLFSIPSSPNAIQGGMPGREGNNPWQLKFSTMFHMTNDSKLFVDEHAYSEMTDAQKAEFVPLYEAKYIHHFDSRFNTYKDNWKTRDDFKQVSLSDHQSSGFALRPRYYVAHSDVVAKLSGKSKKNGSVDGIDWKHNWFMGWRDISCPTNQRTLIASVFPYSGVGHTMPLLFSKYTSKYTTCLIANINSYCLDYTVRNKIAGTHLTYNYMKQFPIFPPSFYDHPRNFTDGVPLYQWIARRVVALVCTHDDVCDFGREVLSELGEPDFMELPHIWNDEERAEIRCQLDAAFFVLYGMNHDEVEYILSTFNANATQSDDDEGKDSDEDSPAPSKKKTKKTSKAQVSIEVNPSNEVKPEVYGNDRHKARILELFDQFRE